MTSIKSYRRCYSIVRLYCNPDAQSYCKTTKHMAFNFSIKHTCTSRHLYIIFKQICKEINQIISNHAIQWIIFGIIRTIIGTCGDWRDNQFYRLHVSTKMFTTFSNQQHKNELVAIHTLRYSFSFHVLYQSTKQNTKATLDR